MSHFYDAFNFLFFPTVATGQTPIDNQCHTHISDEQVLLILRHLGRMGILEHGRELLWHGETKKLSGANVEVLC